MQYLLEEGAYYGTLLILIIVKQYYFFEARRLLEEIRQLSMSFDSLNWNIGLTRPRIKTLW